jgi:hypothetical protein
MYLLNFASWDQVDLPTLIHELTHVWQSLVEGPFYMIEALHDQLIGEGYNYGWVEGVHFADVDGDGQMEDLGPYQGEGAEPDLINGGGDFDTFNHEQQAMIIEHYYIRRYVRNLPESDYTEWQPYANAVHT